jgi:LysR family transcriptional activator of nhaA
VNYKHLQYFMQVAETGSVARASEQLHLTPQTVSGQIQVLEERLGSALFMKSGRRLELTDTGRLALDYARDIFALGAELEAAVRDRSGKGRALELRIGVADAVPKAMVYHLVGPALELPQRVRIVCREWRLERLLAEMALHRLDLVIADAPVPPSVSVRSYSHRLGSSGIQFFATAALRKAFPQPFPRCLDGAPLLMPGEDSAVGQRLRTWLAQSAVSPHVLGEFDDSALAQEFGRRGAGFFPGPTVLRKEIEAQFGVRAVGVADGVEEHFFAISAERRTSHPAVVAITRAARDTLFHDPAVPAAPRRGKAAAG